MIIVATGEYPAYGRVDAGGLSILLGGEWINGEGKSGWRAFLRADTGPFRGRHVSHCGACPHGVFAAQKTGNAAPFSFLMALIAISPIVFCFVALTRVFAHSGSVYAINGVTLGARAGFFSGWALLGTYFAFAAGSVAENRLPPA